MKQRTRSIALTVGILLAFGAACVWWLGRLTPEQQAFRTALQKVVEIAETQPAGQTGRPFSATIELLRAEGLPKPLHKARLDVALSLPDRFRVSTTIDGGRLALGRDGNEIWAWRESKRFAVRGVPGVALFKSNPGHLDATQLEPLRVPEELGLERLSMLPLLCDVRALPPETIDGESCLVIEATLKEAARHWLHADAATLTLWLRGDGFPVQVGYRDGKGGTDVLAAVHDVRFDISANGEGWGLPAAARAGDVHVEAVALHHMDRFLSSAAELLLDPPKVKPLGPAAGETRVIATAGNGRLEERDGTRVLFLRGTPEEMGAQHGELMRADVWRLIDRILYGVGVGSSFEKGEWFFGTIESCQARLQPFVNPRYTREMDAMAVAAGVTSEEARLANFFPELFHCSGFALSGAATKDGHIYHGRILDYMKGVGLEPNAVVMVIQPDEGHAWVNLGYAGFTGTVTAMNEAHISIGEMGGRGEGQWDGKPMAQLMREVMEKAATLDEAIAILRDSPRTCEYYYVIADGTSRDAVGVKATPATFELVHLGEKHPQLDTPVKDTVLLSAGDRYRELVKRVQDGWGRFDADSARELMTRPVCMTSNIQSVLFAPDTLDFWVANADGSNVASHTRYTHYNLNELMGRPVRPAPGLSQNSDHR